MKKKIGIRFLIILLFSLGVTTAPIRAKSKQNTFTQIESGFNTIPDSIQTSVYWYWISDNISEQGVVNDLYAMKKAGINRAFIGNIGLAKIPYGKVKMLSEEWWKILHTALKTATKLNIEIGIFNSPGWSQSGGPWIKSENAMRYLISGQTRVKGPSKFSAKLEKPTPLFQDVKVIAYPAPKDDQLVLNEKNGTIGSSPKVEGISALFDGNKKTGINIQEGDELTITFQAKKSFTARSLIIQPLEVPINVTAILQTKTANGEYVVVKEFEIMRVREDLNVGFYPYAPVVVSFPETTATNFRLIIKNTHQTAWYASPQKSQTGLAELILSASPGVENYAEKTFAKMFPSPLPSWKEYQWSPQREVEDKATMIDGSKVIDISKKLMPDGTLNWDVPAGNWIILRTGMTPTGTKNGPASPEATGYEVDKMSKAHVEDHFYGHMGEVLKRIPEADRKCFKVVVQDSYEQGGQNFTDGFLDEFKQKYGYDATPFLPVYQGLVVNSQSESDRFLWDMRRMVADKVAYDYVGGLRDISHKYGLSTWLECYGHWGFPGEFLMYGGQSDEISGEFWSEGELGNIECRAATSCGHIYGKNKISAESNTCGGAAFSRGPVNLKQRCDRFFAEGINNTLLHVYISQPYEDKNPGLNAPFGNEFNRKNTWFSQMD
ncbi:MAG: glycosyl hydrolase, partial [Prolixibacteraceae bacterium]|nr:glycosyl hydrolase [Prolixibacteraceae bacterium]